MEDGQHGMTGGHAVSHVDLGFTLVLEHVPTHLLLHWDCSVAEFHKMFGPAILTFVNT